MLDSPLSSISHAANVIKQGGVIAYPTEYCFGLGCDPHNRDAVERILKIKQRSVEQGLILIASRISQVDAYADLAKARELAQIKASWPGPVTWLLPIKEGVPAYLSGQHNSIAMRVSQHPSVVALCDLLGFAIVSTSANFHGQPACTSAGDVAQKMSNELDYILDEPLANPASGGKVQASQIRDSMSGEQIR